MSTIQKAAKEVGVDQVVCPNCGEKFGTIELIERFFDGVIELVRRGDRVRIPALGIFRAVMWKGRVHNSPIIPGGEVKYKDAWVLRFKMSAKARKTLNHKEKDDDDS